MPSFYLPKIPLFDPMVDAPEDGINRLSIMANRNFDIIKRLLYGQLDSVNVRSGGILLEDLMGGLLPQDPPVLGAGLNLTGTYMGYYDGNDWKVFIKDDGSFYFGGDNDNYLVWDGSTLSLKGYLDAVLGTFEILGAGDFPEGSRVLMGHVEGEPLIEMYDGEDTLRLTTEKDRISFYTEELGEVNSVYAGMIQGLFWTGEGFSDVPEVRLEAPKYCNIIAAGGGFGLNYYARSGYICYDDDLYARIEVYNDHDNDGNLSVDEMFSFMTLGLNIDIGCRDGDVRMFQKLQLRSDAELDHLEFRLYDPDYYGVGDPLNLKSQMSFLQDTKSLVFVLEEDAENYVFYLGVTPVMELKTAVTAGSEHLTGPGLVLHGSAVITGDLEVMGDVTADNYYEWTP